MKIARKSNFELMRIISMFLIVLWHVIVHGPIFNASGEPALFVKNILLGLIVVHVNSLVFLTGYFSCNKKNIKWKKVFKLFGLAWFYKALIVLIFYHFNFMDISKIKLMEELLPLDLNNYWFINHYIVLYIISPFLNIVTEKMSEEKFFNFILLLILIFSIIPYISNGRVINNNGSSFINFIIIYYLGSYFRKYPLKDNFHLKNITKRKLQIILIFLFFTFAFINITLSNFGKTMCDMNSSFFNYYGKIITGNYLLYSNPIVIIQSCIYCLFFETIEIKSRLINYFSATTLGIYLIHDHHLVREKLYNWILLPTKDLDINVFVLLIKTSLVIFIGCVIIESTRRILVKILELLYNKTRKKKMFN